MVTHYTILPPFLYVLSRNRMMMRKRLCPHLPAQRKSLTKHTHVYPSHTQTKDQAFMLSMLISHKWTDRQINRLELYFSSSTCFVLRVPTHLVTLKAHVTFGCPTDSSVKWWYTGVPLFPEFLKGFFISPMGMVVVVL